MQVVIGLEGHAQITPRSRLLSGAPTAFEPEPEPEPNSQVSLIDPALAERELTRPLTICGNKYCGRWRKFKEFTVVRLPWLDAAGRLGRSRLRERGGSA